MRKQNHLCIGWLVLVTFFFSCGLVNQPKYINLSEEEQIEYQPVLLNDSIDFFQSYENKSNHNLYATNANEIKNIIKKSTKDFSLIVFYAHYCVPCKPAILRIDSIHRKYTENLQVLYLSTEDWLRIEKDRKYLASQNLLAGASLGLDIYKYGTQFNSRSRMRNIVKELGIYDESVLGFPTVILFNKNLDILAVDGGNIVFKKLSDLLNDKKNK